MNTHLQNQRKINKTRTTKRRTTPQQMPETKEPITTQKWTSSSSCLSTKTSSDRSYDSSVNEGWTSLVLTKSLVLPEKNTPIIDQWRANMKVIVRRSCQVIKNSIVTLFPNAPERGHRQKVPKHPISFNKRTGSPRRPKKQHGLGKRRRNVHLIGICNWYCTNLTHY